MQVKQGYHVKPWNFSVNLLILLRIAEHIGPAQPMWPHHHRCQELWPRYIGASNRQTVDHKPSEAPPDGADICAGQTAAPGYRPPVWPAAELQEAVSAAFWRPDPMKLLSQLSTQFQIQATENDFNKKDKNNRTA